MSGKIEDHAECVKVSILLCSMLENYDIAGAIDRGQKALDHGALFHPSEWIAKHEDLEQDMKVLKAALPLANLAEQIRQRIAAKESAGGRTTRD